MSPTSRNTVEALVAFAVQAPSSHNTQPWLFEATDAGVAVFADRSRALRVNDPRDRELTISCGAALFNLEQAAHGLGFDSELTVLPDPDRPDLLAELALHPSDVFRRDTTLFEAIRSRRTTRKRFDPGPVPEGLASELAKLVAGHGASLHMIEAEARRTLAELVAEGDRLQFGDPRWRRELASWMHPRRKRDGLVVPAVVGLVTRAVVLAFNVGKWVAVEDQELLQAGPLVVILATEADDPRAWIHAGRALEHLLLCAASQGVHAGYLNQPCQLEQLRGRVRQLLPVGQHPQLLIRLGPLSGAPRASPRRPVADVLRNGPGDGPSFDDV